MNSIDQDTFEAFNASDASLCLEDLSCAEEEQEPKNAKSFVSVPSCVFVSYGTRSLMIRTDMDDSFSEIKKTIQDKTGIPAEEQVLAWNHSGKVVDNDKSLRNYAYWGGAFCTLTKA